MKKMTLDVTVSVILVLLNGSIVFSVAFNLANEIRQESITNGILQLGEKFRDRISS